MTLTKKSACRNSEYQKVSFDLKLSIIDQIINGQISVNHASKVHNISRSSITYWMQKLRTFEQKSKGMSKNDEIKNYESALKHSNLSKKSSRILLQNWRSAREKISQKSYYPNHCTKRFSKRNKAVQNKMAL
jgi:transposase-like protein